MKKVARKENKESSFPVSAAAEMKASKRVGKDRIKFLQINKRVLSEAQKVEEVGDGKDIVLKDLEKLTASDTSAPPPTSPRPTPRSLSAATCASLAMGQTGTL